MMDILNIQTYEYVNHPSHYCGKDGKDCIDYMIEEFGLDKVLAFCQLNSYKYVFRAGKKQGDSREQDLKKADWYDNKYKELVELNYGN